jgi:DNA-binding HxlR family transcriptional regulator
MSTTAKSIRKDMFVCLDTHGEQTMDDLVNRIDGYTRGQLSNNVQAARKEELVASRRDDDVTGSPAYRLTPLGKERLAEILGKAKPAPSRKPEPKNMAPIQAQPKVPGLEAYNLRCQLELAEKQRDAHFAEVEQAKKIIDDLQDDVRRHVEAHNRLSTEIIHFLIATQQLTGMDHKPSNMQEAEEQISAAFNLMRGRVEELELAVDMAQQAVASMELAEEQAANDAVDVKDAAVGYLVRVPGKKTRICIKPDNARNAALSAARTHGRADVLALVPVGKAVKGAEWKDAA